MNFLFLSIMHLSVLSYWNHARAIIIAYELLSHCQQTVSLSDGRLCDEAWHSGEARWCTIDRHIYAHQLRRSVQANTFLVLMQLDVSVVVDAAIVLLESGECWLMLVVLSRIWTSDGFLPPRILSKKLIISYESHIESVEGSMLPLLPTTDRLPSR